jgi:hypothetical protein
LYIRHQLVEFTNFTAHQYLYFQQLPVGTELAILQVDELDNLSRNWEIPRAPFKRTLRFIDRLPGKDRMLKIQRSANGAVVFKLSGRLENEHIAELETVIDAETKDRRIVLDLQDMTLTGEDGINFLARCEAAGITLVNCDPYVREWITRQRNGS